MTNERTFTPLAYQRLGPAWRAALALLDEGTWVTREELYAAMLPASDIQKKSCNSLLAQGRQAGVLEAYPAPKDGRVYRSAGTKGPQRFRLRPEMRNHEAVRGVVRSASELESDLTETVK